MRGVLAIDSRGRLIYPAASVVVAFDVAANSQEHFMGHTDDVCALAQHPTRPDVIASGQMAHIENGRSQDPFVCVYDWSTKETWRLPALSKQRRVAALAFSCDGKYLASAGFDDSFTITVWDWESKSVVGTIGSIAKAEIASLAWSPKTPGELCAVGPKSVGFYYLGAGGSFEYFGVFVWLSSFHFAIHARFSISPCRFDCQARQARQCGARRFSRRRLLGKGACG